MDTFGQELELDSNESVAEEDDQEVKIEAFNLKQETEEGVFDQDGNYVRTKEESEDEDWLNDVKKEDIQKARAAEMRQDEERRKLKDQKARRLRSANVNEVIGQLSELMEPAESVVELLQRLNGEARRLKKKGQKEDEKRVREQISQVMSAIEVLEDGFAEIYEVTREELMRKLPTAPASERKRKREDPSAELWYYRWPGQNEIYGPYDSATMEAWREAYFVDNPVEYRRGNEPFRLLDDSTMFL
ncbi:hypothetical protein KL929_000944 [Ogataea haglerorum]|uniref:uncharacterized protein n=1 Tax=Ogataea haglerorum TaxID=1937702 RepID=UPI001C88F740|nr:uncharacterized protein KL911_003431 [Ogataea haglerorum]KAG7701719.1 hypothetical protein KL951_000175 [Ogataea haglerorum]KAG7722356.1 hypothetical protein KL913_000176 [Ogataea haglerorum]KAG7723540.1 hypothetical protein KL949_000590 [Ogataea haglerorum]KAG7734609.1 hypothetical protein KL948_000175 [Ogataea haglerorum]KAG7742973.1 hypothetical protein KL923_000588 [Ogataea haglerorum]